MPRDRSWPGRGAPLCDDEDEDDEDDDVPFEKWLYVSIKGTLTSSSSRNGFGGTFLARCGPATQPLVANAAHIVV